MITRLDSYTSKSGLITVLADDVNESRVQTHHVQVFHPNDFDLYHELTRIGYNAAFFDVLPNKRESLRANTQEVGAEASMRLDFEEFVHTKKSLKKVYADAMQVLYKFKPITEDLQDFLSDAKEFYSSEQGDEFPEDFFSLEYCVSPSVIMREQLPALLEQAPQADFSVYELRGKPDKDFFFLEDVLENYFRDLEVLQLTHEEFRRHEILRSPFTKDYLYGRF